MDLQSANNDMVNQFIAEGALWSAPLIAAFRATPRHWFVRRIFQFQRSTEQWQEHVLRDPSAAEIEMIYADRAWITHLKKDSAGNATPVSSSSQPSLMAQILEELHLQPGSRVLEVGAGTGYNSALIAHVVGVDCVVAIDVDLDVVSEAWDHLRNVADRRIQVQQADGRLGFPDGAPFDRIVVTASSTGIEPAWLKQMAQGAVLSVPLELSPGLAFILRGEMIDGILHGRLTRPAYFLALRDKDHWPDDKAQSDLPETGKGERAPWADWLKQRPTRLRWFPLVQSFAFWGWLHDFAIHYRTGADGQPSFAIASPDNQSWCWLTPTLWNFNNKSGRKLACDLWKSFLKHGGPWPSDFRLSVSPNRDLKPEFRPRFRKQGHLCRQLWELTPNRRRSSW